MRETDVLIAGAGPAGAALAIALSRAGGLRVMLVDRGGTPPARGETLPGAARALLRDLGALARFEADAHSQSLGHASVWGSNRLERRDGFADPQGPGWRLDRAVFDEALVAEALRQGCQRIERAVVASVHAVDAARGGWHVRLTGEDGSTTGVHCRFIVDATGRRASIARRLGVARQRIDALVTASLILPRQEATALDAVSLIETVEDGWYFSTCLPDSRRIIAFHTDHDLAQADPGVEAFSRRLARTAMLGRYADLHPERLQVRRAAAWSGRLAVYGGPAWAAVGDAALCFDPLSSQGLFNALHGGLKLGHAIRDVLAVEDTAALHAYFRQLDAIWMAYLRHRNIYYGAERRWPSAPFWQRRSGQPRIDLWSGVAP